MQIKKGCKNWGLLHKVVELKQDCQRSQSADILTFKTGKETSKEPSKQTSKQTSKQANKQTSKQASNLIAYVHCRFTVSLLRPIWASAIESTTGST